MAPATRKSAELRAKRAKSTTTTTAATRDGDATGEGGDATAAVAADESEEEVTTEEFEVELDDGATWAMNFYECAAEGDVTFLKQILDESKVGVDEVDVDGFTALMIAAAEGHKDIVVELLARGADVAVRTHELRSTALHFAAKNGDAEIVEAICKQDARYVDCWNINADTPLIWACIEGRAECVRVLLAHNADVNVVNQYGATTLICSVMIGEDPEEDESDDARSEIIKMLLAKNPKLVNFQDREGSTAMHLAASCGYLQSVKTLLELGADITLRNAIGQTPLEEAEQTGLEESDVCVDHLRTIWQNLEEEAAARMMTMLEMEEQSAAGSKSAGAANSNAINSGIVGGAVAAGGSKKSKKKNKKQKRKAAAKQQAPNTGGGVNGAAGGDGSGASSLDGKFAENSERVSSGESSDEDEAEKAEPSEDDGPAAPVDTEASELQGSEEQSDDSAALSGVWTTVGKKQPSKFSAAVAPEEAEAETAAAARETSSPPLEGNVASTPGGRTSKSPAQKVVPFRRKLKQHRYDTGAPDDPVTSTTVPSTSPTSSSSSTARSSNGIASTSAPWLAQDKKSTSSAPESARAGTAAPPSRPHSSIGSTTHSAALPYSSTPIFSSSSSLFSSPFSSRTQERARGHLGFASSWRSSGFSSGATGSATGGPQASALGYASANRSLWKHSQRVSGTQLAAAEAKDKWVGRLHLANENVSEAIGYLACGICGELVNDNLQCSVSVNGSGCAQLYCGTCLAKTLAMTDGLSLKCVKCRQFMNRDEMRPNHFAQAQAASLGLPGSSSTQQFNSTGSQNSSQEVEAHLTVDEMKLALENSIPNAAIVDLNPFYLTPGCDLAVLSNGQLEILEQAHQLALTQIMETRIANARAQERMQIEEWMKTQRDILHYAAMTAAAANANATQVTPVEDQQLPSSSNT